MARFLFGRLHRIGIPFREHFFLICLSSGGFSMTLDWLFPNKKFLRKQGFQTSRFAGKQGFWNSKALGVSGGKGSFPDSDPSTCFSDLQQGHVYIYHRIKAVGFRSATWSVSFRRTWFQTVAARCALTKSLSHCFFLWRPFLSVWVAVDVQWRWIDCFQISK